MRKFPTLSHLQALVLGELLSDKTLAELDDPPGQSGKQLRRRMGAYGQMPTLPSFYQLMARIVAAGLVRQDYIAVDGPNRTQRECWYTATPEGRQALKTTQQFYSHVVRKARKVRETMPHPSIAR